MPDITMCKNVTCPDREQCYRWTAKPSGWQAYAWFDGPSLHKRCLNFLDISRQMMPERVEQQGVVDTINTEPIKVQ